MIHRTFEQMKGTRKFVEAVYVLEGTGTVEIMETGEIYKLAPGVFYAFDKHERHRYNLDSEVRAIAIFNPPLVGDEVNDESGGYAIKEDAET